MKRFFCVIAVIFIMYGTEGMLQTSFRSFDMHNDRSIFFSPVGVQVIINQITVDKFLDDSDVLYISIDDFLDDKCKSQNEVQYFQFIQECNDLVFRYDDYKNALIQNIIPQFEKFAQEDAACEVAELYDDKKVEAFVKYLNMRLEFLKTLARS